MAGSIVVNGQIAPNWTAQPPVNSIGGLTLSNDSTTPNSVLDVTIGSCADSTNQAFLNLYPAFTKSTAGAWAQGSGSNGMGTGLTITATTWYHVFVIATQYFVDIYFDTSPTAANIPTQLTLFRRIGSFLTDGSAHIIPFTQYGNEFLWKTRLLDINGAATSASAASKTLTVPTGVEIYAKYGAVLAPTSGTVVYTQFYALDQGTQATGTPNPSASLAGSGSTTQFAGEFVTRTNTSAQIGVVSSGTAAALSVSTYGWVDPRGAL